MGNREGAINNRRVSRGKASMHVTPNTVPRYPRVLKWTLQEAILHCAIIVFGSQCLSRYILDIKVFQLFHLRGYPMHLMYFTIEVQRLKLMQNNGISLRGGKPLDLKSLIL